MPAPHPIISSFKSYIKNDFALPTQEYWVVKCKPKTGNDVIEVKVSHKEVKEALRKLGLTDPFLFRLLSYLIFSNRTKSDIAAAVGVDPSTIGRKWHAAIKTILNWIFNGDLCIGDELAPIDIRLLDNYFKGDTIEDILQKYKQKALEEARQELSLSYRNR